MNARHLQFLILWLILFALLARFVWFSATAARERTIGFSGYYAPALLLLEGEDVRSFYDDDWLSAQIDRFEPGIRQIYFVNPPTMSLLLLPLAWLPYSTARIVWTLGNAAALCAMMFWLARQLHFSGNWLPLFFILVLLYHPVYVNITIGQVYIVLLGFQLLAWHGYRQNKDGLLGAMLGLMLIFKLAGLLLWPLLAIQKRWRAMVWGGVTAVAIAATSLPWLGTAAWQEQLSQLQALSHRPRLLATAYQTWHGFAGRLFVIDSQWNPTPLFADAVVGRWLNVLGVILLLAISLFAAYWASRWPGLRVADSMVDDLLFALFITLGMIISPLTLDYHYPLLLLPLAVVFACVRERDMGPRIAAGQWLLLLVVFLLVATDLPYRSPRLADGAWVLLAYPKLYGTLLLWALTLWQLYLRLQPTLVMPDKVITTK